MTNDLVERLRDFDPHLHEWEVVDEAADHIEYLTAEVQRWQGLFDEKHRLMLEQKACTEKAEADNARLRDALEAMQQAHCKADLVHRGKVWRDVMKLINVALNTGKG